MTTASTLLESNRKEPEDPFAVPKNSLSPLLGVVWIVGTAGGWMVVLLGVHYLMALVLGR